MESPSTPRHDLALGEIIAGRYRIEALIGRGGSGRVYRATQLSVGREVAIKIVDPEDQDAVARFRREANLVKQLEHPNAVRLFDVGTTERGVPFVVMELLRGATVHEIIATRGALDPAAALSVAAQILKALSEAHAKGIVHRDIKPANVFVTSPYGQPIFVKVIDFGIAKQPRRTMVTREGDAPGTPPYMAPEQVIGEHVDARADLYAVGLLLAEMLTGRRVYRDRGPLTLMLAQINPEPVPLDPTIDALPGGAIVRRAVAKSADDRYPSALAMLAAVDAELARIVPLPRPTQVTPPSNVLGPATSVMERTPGATSPIAPPLPMPPAPETRASSEVGSAKLRLLVAAIAVLVAATLALGAMILLRRAGDSPRGDDDDVSDDARDVPLDPRVLRARSVDPESVRAILRTQGWRVEGNIVESTEGLVSGGYDVLLPPCQTSLFFLDMRTPSQARGVANGHAALGRVVLVEGRIVLYPVDRLDAGPSSRCTRDLAEAVAAR